VPFIRKARAGNDSFGNCWPHDGAVIEVPPEQAGALLAIRDGQFSEASPPTVEPETAEISEAPKPRRGRPPKTAAGQEQIEE
jgi:hypothetical protein